MKIEGSNEECVRSAVDERDSDVRAALMHAVCNNHTECIKLLVEHGAVVDSALEGIHFTM